MFDAPVCRQVWCETPASFSSFTHRANATLTVAAVGGHTVIPTPEDRTRRVTPLEQQRPEIGRDRHFPACAVLTVDYHDLTWPMSSAEARELRRAAAACTSVVRAISRRSGTNAGLSPVRLSFLGRRRRRLCRSPRRTAAVHFHIREESEPHVIHPIRFHGRAGDLASRSQSTAARSTPHDVQLPIDRGLTDTPSRDSISTARDGTARFPSAG